MKYGNECAIVTYEQLIPDCTPVTCNELARAEKGSTACNSGFCVQDVVQGALKDCYLMAALASVAWAAPATMSTKYNTMAASLPNKKIPVDGSGNPCYARIGPRNVIWPLVYERAYAKQKGCDPCANPNGPVRPTCIEGGTGMQGLVDITGWRSFPLTISTFATSQVPNNGGIATVPAVAWTDDRALPTNIFKKHTYSYLGHSDGYVVLRNPYGPLKSEPTGSVRGSGIFRNDCCGTIDFAVTSDGIFGLELSVFKSNFAGIGYVRQ